MLWLIRADGANPRQLTRPLSQFDGVESMSWSPDAAHIAITRFDQSVSQIHLVDVARAGSSQQITSEPGGAFDPAWSPDGRYIAYAARVNGKVSIKIHDTTGLQTPFTLVESDLARSPRWSPNGSALAYIALAGQDFELHVVDVTSDADGHLTAGRPLLLTGRFGVDATSGLSWAP
jgi:TolB protein